METKKSSIYSGIHVTVIVMTCEMTSDDIQHRGCLGQGYWWAVLLVVAVMAFSFLLCPEKTKKG